MKNRRGIALITVVVIMLTIALIGASLVELASTVNISAHNVIDEAKARYLAEAGIAQAIHALRTSATDSGEGPGETIGPIPLGDGVYTVTFNVKDSLIISVGEVNGVSKKVQLQYSAL